jgi:hypothetical protein
VKTSRVVKLSFMLVVVLLSRCSAKYFLGTSYCGFVDFIKGLMEGKYKKRIDLVYIYLLKMWVNRMLCITRDH